MVQRKSIHSNRCFDIDFRNNFVRIKIALERKSLNNFSKTKISPKRKTDGEEESSSLVKVWNNFEKRGNTFYDPYRRNRVKYVKKIKKTRKRRFILTYIQLDTMSL